MVSIKNLAFFAFGAFAMCDVVASDVQDDSSAATNDTINGVPKEVHGALSRALNSFSLSDERIDQDVGNDTSHALANLASSVQNTNSALWQVSEACCIFCKPMPVASSCCGSCCAPSCGCYGSSYTVSGIKYNLAVDGKPKVGNLFPVFLQGNMNYVKDTLGSSLAPTMKKMAVRCNDLSEQIASGSLNEDDTEEAQSLVAELKKFSRNTNGITAVDSEREELNSALKKLSSALSSN
ncbi:hypothetical protein TRICI_000415 [Trichomonascus ciferrii]|uniref:Uncharacterized protein n=1 Tax=Trichomonascus ciferrii TaxID=44093 RepID=A0A642VDH3_9ASCO|nr:hypothetical protein TRICI_000415 [Trichomonascus ciferrii]